MLQRYQSIIPSGVTVAESRVVARFFPVTGAINLGRMNVNVANGGGATSFRLRVNNVLTGPTITIASGQREALDDTLDIAVSGGDQVEVLLTAWPAGGVVGPASVEVGVEDGESAGGTDEPLDKALLVSGYYLGALGREVEESELAADLTALESACIAATFLTQVSARIEALFDDLEFGTVTDAVFVQRVYRSYFNREPDAGGQAFWEAQLADGGAPANAANREAMRGNFASHQEYINRLAMYCRAQLPVANAYQILGQDPAAYVASVVTGAVVTDLDLVVYTTGALAHGASEDVLVPMGGKYWRIMGVESSHSLWVRGYFRAAQRTADAARPLDEDPAGEHGCYLDHYNPATNLNWDVTPPYYEGMNKDDPSGPDQAKAILRITNLSGATRTVTLILHRRLM